jgi:DNA mismatch repair ATPase MutS
VKVHLLSQDRDFDLDLPLPSNEQALREDLGLDPLFSAMAGGDEFLFRVARQAVLKGSADPRTIVYRQEVLRDCLEHPDAAIELYNVSVEAVLAPRQTYLSTFGRSPELVLHTSLRLLELLVPLLRRLRAICDEHTGDFRSEGFRALVAMLDAELDDDYFKEIECHLRELRFKEGTLVSARLGTGLKGRHYVLRAPRARSWRDRFPMGRRDVYAYQVAPRDESGARALAELRGRGIDPVANALAQSADHVLQFFGQLRAELGFYVSCLKLRDRLAARHEPICLPSPRPADRPTMTARGLYDVSLSLDTEDRLVGNDVDAEGKTLVMITGANQGGKSTFLRSVGVAQLMMQAGMFVGAESFSADVRDGVFTHFKREEDLTMRSGKLDEELTRMSDLVDAMSERALLLSNESFASTNEREGSEIAWQIVRALLDSGVKVVFVTHLFELARGVAERRMDDALFLRAERLADGRRTFRLLEGEPLSTSFGQDLYLEIFGTGGR